MSDVLLDLPKVELHVHLEGTITAGTARELARRHGEDPTTVFGLDGDRYPARFRDFDHFVHLYIAVSDRLREPEDLHTVAASFARRQAEQNVRYTETTFTALRHVRNGMEPTAMWEAVAEGLRAGGPDCDIRLIVDSVRDEHVGHAEDTVALVEGARGAPIVGLGLAGTEGSVPERDFAVLREGADRLGLGLAVHAGESGGPDNIRAALDDLGADRIGHGVAAVRDPDLVERLAREQVPLEVCPTSNVVTGVVASLEQHPFPALWQAGVNVTVNSDDPPYFDTTLTDELRHAARLADLTTGDLAELQRRAARAAFAPDGVRQRLIDAIDAWESLTRGGG